MRSRAAIVLVGLVMVMVMVTGVAAASGGRNDRAGSHHEQSQGRGNDVHGHGHGHGHRHGDGHGSGRGITIYGEVGKGTTRPHRHKHWLHRRHSSGGAASDALRYVGTRHGRRSTHGYLRADPFIVGLPGRTPTTLSGWLDLRKGVRDTVATIGLVDLASLKKGQTGRQEGAFLYVFTRPDGSVRIGLTDGNIGGELVQVSKIYPAGAVPDKVKVAFTVEATDVLGELKNCATHDADVDTADGCMTLVIDDGSASTEIVDSYGTITAPGFDDEFARGAVPGWEAWPGGRTGIKYFLRVDGAYRR